MTWRRIYAMFVARNLEFLRDRMSLAWNVLLPVAIIFVFAYAFTEDDNEKFKVGLVAEATLQGAAARFRETRYIRFIDFDVALHFPNGTKISCHFFPNIFSFLPQAGCNRLFVLNLTCHFLDSFLTGFVFHPSLVTFFGLRF